MNETGWTVHTLKEHFEVLLEEKEKLLNSALASAKEAVLVAERNAEKWRDNANEWRAAMNDKDKKFLLIETFDTWRESTEKLLMAEKERGDIGKGKSMGIREVIGWVIAGVSAIGYVVATYLKK